MPINRRKFVKAAHDAGIPLLAGTDSGIDLVAPGSSLLDELREFTRAGLSPCEALAAATRDASRYLHEEGEFGTVEPGKRADLLLLERNPLNDIEAMSSRLGVMARGRWYARKTEAQ